MSSSSRGGNNGGSRNSSRSNGKASKNGKARRKGQNGKAGSSKGGQKGQQPSTKARNRKRKKSKFNARQFWGSPSQLPTPTGYTTTTDDPISLVTSLGRPPIPGNENAAEAYFQMLYTRAGALAGALAAAGGLDQIVAVEAPKTSEGDEGIDEASLHDDADEEVDDGNGDNDADDDDDDEDG